MRSRAPPGRMIRPKPSASLPSLSKSNSSPALQWLPPSRLEGTHAQAERGVQEMVMASWLREFGERDDFGSPVVFVELQLRQALAATAAAGGRPDAFRTACICECLGRLPEVAGHFASVLSLLRQELMRAIYVGYEPFGRTGSRQVDAQSLLSRPTYFTECFALRKRVVHLEERLNDWLTTKEALMQDADGRNELLRLAAAKWSTVLTTIRDAAGGGTPEAMQETTRRLAGLLDAMQQHSKAIDELQRVALLEVRARCRGWRDAF